MRIIILLILGSVFGQLLCAATYISEHIDADTRWTKANSPYIIVNDIMIKEGVTLSIEAGANILFSAETKLLVYGTLSAKGSKSKKISFSGKDGAAWNGFEYFRTCGQYDTLSSKGCVFEHCNFLGAGDAPGHLIRTRGCNLKMSDCKIENCYTAVQSERQARIYLYSNRFIGCNRPINVRNTSLATVEGNKFIACNSILLGGTTDFKNNLLKKFTDKGRHSGLVIWMLGGGIVNIEHNKFLDFEGYALKVQKMSRRSTLELTHNSFKGNAINLQLACAEAGKGKVTIASNNFKDAKETQLKMFGNCEEVSGFYLIAKNYWGKMSADTEKLKNVKVETAALKAIR
jgi:hypothetical protein